MEISRSRNGGNQSLLRCITSQPVNLVAVSFAHDSFARMTTDAEAGLSITYNAFDLPETISSGNTLQAKYTYLSDGTKVSAFEASGAGLVYRGPFTYRRSSGGTLAFESAPFDRGRLTEAGARYHVTDHLGSVRAVIDGNASTTTYPLAGFYSVDDFAPFGVKSASSASSYLSLASTGSTVSLRDGFTGQEDQGQDFGVGYSDFGARQYSPTLSRWLVPDPMGEKYYDVSPYAYCAGNPVNRVDIKGKADFWLNGQIIGDDGVHDQRALVIRTEALTKEEIKETTGFIKANSGSMEAFKDNDIAYRNSIEIESSVSNRQAMVTEISKDNGKGGTDDSNNREYGGSIQNGRIVSAEPGPIANPKTDAIASIDLPTGVSTFHSHPSGTIVEYPPANTIGGSTTTYSFIQQPSGIDISNAGTNTHYVFGRSSGNVYIYTSEGVQAIIPMKYFVTPKDKR